MSDKRYVDTNQKKNIIVKGKKNANANEKTTVVNMNDYQMYNGLSSDND